MNWLRSYTKLHPLQAIFLISLVYPLFFLLHGYSGDDLLFHLSSWTGIVQGWKSGVWFPGWHSAANYGLGEPRFLFYPPVSHYAGALVLLLLPNRFGPALLLLLLSFFAGISMYSLARSVAPGHALPAALLYCTGYYFALESIIRFAIAETFVAAFLPLLMLGYVELLFGSHPVNRKFTLLLALVWLTNIPAAIVTFYTLGAATLVVCARRRTFTPAIRFGLCQILALGLSGLYLLPALITKKQLIPNGIESVFAWKDFLLFHHPSRHIPRSLTYPLWFWSLTGLPILLYRFFRRRRELHNPVQPFTAMDVIDSFLWLPLIFQLPFDGFLWQHLPALSLVAFSFRFLLFFSVSLALSLPVLLRTRAVRAIALTLWGAFLCLPILDRIEFGRKHGAPPSFAALHSQALNSVPGFPEYLPAGHGAVPPEKGPYQPIRVDAPAVQACAYTIVRWSPEDKVFHTTGAVPCRFELGLFYFPEWSARLDNNSPLSLQPAPDQHIQLLVPAGSHTVTVSFHRALQPTVEGILLSALSLLLLAVGSAYARPGVRKERLIQTLA